MKIELVKVEKRKDKYYDYCEYVAIKNNTRFVAVYQGYDSWRRTTRMKRTGDWYYVVEYIRDHFFVHEHFDTFKEAKARALEIAKESI